MNKNMQRLIERRERREDERQTERCRNCLWSGWRKCGRLYCALPSCVDAAVAARLRDPARR